MHDADGVGVTIAGGKIRIRSICEGTNKLLYHLILKGFKIPIKGKQWINCVIHYPSVRKWFRSILQRKGQGKEEDIEE